MLLGVCGTGGTGGAGGWGSCGGCGGWGGWGAGVGGNGAAVRLAAMVVVVCGVDEMRILLFFECPAWRE